METCVSALLEAITIGQALGAAGGLSVAGVGIGWVVRQNRRIDGKAEQAALEELRECQRERCAACRREVDAALERKASKAEVIEHTATLAEHRESLAAIRAEMSALSKGIDGVREDLRRLTDRLERWMEREP